LVSNSAKSIESKKRSEGKGGEEGRGKKKAPDTLSAIPDDFVEARREEKKTWGGGRKRGVNILLKQYSTIPRKAQKRGGKAGKKEKKGKKKRHTFISAFDSSPFYCKLNPLPSGRGKGRGGRERKGGKKRKESNFLFASFSRLQSLI